MDPKPSQIPSHALTPEELAAERAAWKEREKRRQEEREKKPEQPHPWRRFRAASAPRGIDSYVPHGYTGTGRKW